MRDVLGTDFKMTDFDLIVEDGDFALVTGTECLKQDLTHAMLTPLFFWGMEIDFGSRLTEFVEGDNDPFYVADLRRAVNEVFDKESRVQRDSQVVAVFKTEGGVEIEAGYLPIEQETAESLMFIIANGGQYASRL